MVFASPFTGNGSYEAFVEMGKVVLQPFNGESDAFLLPACGRADFGLYYSTPLLPLRISSSPSFVENEEEGEEEEESLSSSSSLSSLSSLSSISSSSSSSSSLVHLLLLGELNKWVPFSPQRFLSLSYHHPSLRPPTHPPTHSSLYLTLQGKSGEEVELSFAVLAEEGGGEEDVVRVGVTMDERGVGRVRIRVVEEEKGRRRVVFG